MDDTLNRSVEESMDNALAPDGLPAQDYNLHPLANTDPAIKPENLDLLMEVSLHVTVELGRREMRFGEILRLGKGSVVELNKLADDPVDIYVNQSKVAEGEVVVVDEHFGVRITKLLNSERLKR